MSGKSPKASESTTETIKFDSLCLSIAEIMLALVPTVTTSSTASLFSCETNKIDIGNTRNIENTRLNILFIL